MLLSQQRAVKWPEKEASFSNSPTCHVGKCPVPRTPTPSSICLPQRPHPCPKASWACWKTSLEDRYLDLILRVVDHESIGQGVLGERGEVGLGQQGLQRQQHLLLIGQALGVR